jgi:hypothetical protein
MVNPEIKLMQLIDAYTATSYVVLQNGEAFTLRVGERSSVLDQLLASHRKQTAAFMTASNPYSSARSESENVEANVRLRADLMKVSIALLEGYGQGEDGEWPAEQSFLAVGITRNDAEAIGRRYQQNAILWIGPNRVPELAILVGSEFVQD